MFCTFSLYSPHKHALLTQEAEGERDHPFDIEELDSV